MEFNPGFHYTPQSFAVLVKAVERAIQTGHPYNIEVEYIHRTGRRGWLDVSGAAERDATGRVVRLHRTGQEITEMWTAHEASDLIERIVQPEARFKEAKEKNQQFENAATEAVRLGAVGLIASGIANEYNNVLTSLTAIMQLRRRASGEAKSLQLASQGREVIDRATSLIRRLMNECR